MRITGDPEMEFLVGSLPEQKRTENSKDGSGPRTGEITWRLVSELFPVLMLLDPFSSWKTKTVFGELPPVTRMLTLTFGLVSKMNE